MKKNQLYKEIEVWALTWLWQLKMQCTVESLKNKDTTTTDQAYNYDHFPSIASYTIFPASTINFAN